MSLTEYSVRLRSLNFAAVRFLFFSTAMLISLCQWELSRALPLLNFQTDRANNIMLARPKHWKYRMLYVGSDLALTTFLKDELKRLDCFVVRCPDGRGARLFIESDINYSLLLFDKVLPDMSGAELERFTQAVKHRKHTPVIIFKKSDDLNLLIETLKKSI